MKMKILKNGKKNLRSAKMRAISESSLSVSNLTSSTQNVPRENTDKKITNLINMSKEEWNAEVKIYESQEKIDFSNDTRSISKSIYDDPYYGDYYLIDSGIPVYDQGSTSTCVAHSSCFVYTYVMVVGINRSLKDMSWWDYAKSPNAPPLASTMLKWIENLYALSRINTNRNLPIGVNWENYIRNNSNTYVGKLMDTTIFSRTFMMWTAYYLPDPPFSVNRLTKSEGTQILNLLEGIKNFGCVIIYNDLENIISNFIGAGLLNTIPFNFYTLESKNEDFSFDLYNNITNLAFKGLTNHPNKPTNTIKTTNEIVNIVRKNISEVTDTTWNIIKDNSDNDQNIKIISLENNEKTIIETLRAGYPFIFSMRIFNYKKDGPIPLEVKNGLQNVLKYVDSSQIIDNAAPEYHAVVAVGYIKNNGVFYIKVRNSWGMNFGGGTGHFYMPITFMTNFDSITKDLNCTSLFTITLNSDTFPKIKKVYFTNDKTSNVKVDTITISKFNLNLIDYLYIQNVDTNELTFKFEKLSNSDFYDVSLTGSELIINRKSNTAGQCKIIVSSKYLKDESIILNWNIDLLYFTYGGINRIPVAKDAGLSINTEVTDLSTLLFSNINDKITYSIKPLPMLEMNALVNTNNKLILTSNKKGGCTITAFQENTSLTAMCNLLWDYNVGPRPSLYFTLNKNDLSNVYNGIDYITIKSEITDLSNFLYSKSNDKINYSIKPSNSFELNASLSGSILRITNSNRGSCELTVVQENTLLTANVQLSWGEDVGPTQLLYFTLNKNINPPIKTNSIDIKRNNLGFIINSINLSSYTYASFISNISYSISNKISGDAFISGSVLNFTSQSGSCIIEAYNSANFLKATVTLTWRM